MSGDEKSDPKEIPVPVDLVEKITTQTNHFSAYRKSLDEHIKRSKLIEDVVSTKIENSFELFRGQLDLKDAEIKRLKAGHDLEIYKNFLGKFVRVHIGMYRELSSSDDPELFQGFGDILELLEDALRECSVFVKVPTVEELRKTPGTFHISQVETDKPDLDGVIERVVHPLYYLRSGDDIEILREARVRVFKLKGKTNV